LYIGGVRVNGWWLASLLFAFSNPLFCLFVSYFTQYARGLKIVVPLTVLSFLTGALYIGNTVMVSVIFEEGTETIVTVLGLALGFIPLSNWI
jgi:hypothetical protein